MLKSLLPVLAAGLVVAQPLFSEPHYTDDGELRLPAGSDVWVFVGSNLGLAYAEETAAATMTDREAGRAATEMFHNIYMEPEAYRSFIETGRFRDPTEFLMEVYTADTKDPGGLLNEGSFNGRLVAVEAAVKDSRRPTRPGSEAIWAYYAFDVDDAGQPADSAAAFDDADCFACHDAHAGYDHVWVQFYPRLRARLAR